IAGQETEMLQHLAEIKRIEGESGPLWHYGAAVMLLPMARPKGKEALAADGKRLLFDARKHLAEAAKKRPNRSRGPALEAEVDELEGNVQGAIDSYQRALKLGDRRPQVVRRLVDLLVKGKRFTEADQAVRKLLDQEQTLLSAGLGQLATEVLLRNADPD